MYAGGTNWVFAQPAPLNRSPPTFFVGCPVPDVIMYVNCHLCPSRGSGLAAVQKLAWSIHNVHHPYNSCALTCCTVMNSIVHYFVELMSYVGQFVRAHAPLYRINVFTRKTRRCCCSIFSNTKQTSKQKQLKSSKNSNKTF